MKILVTGGSGFIGHFLVEELLEKGIEVKVIDIKEPKTQHKNLTFIKKSMFDLNKEDIEGCDAVYHLAALLGVTNSDNHPLKTLQVNIDGTVKVFEEALKAGVKRVIYTSSSEIYGEATQVPMDEDIPKAPVSMYGVSKLTAEMYARGYNQKHSMHISPVRLFNVYGPGQGFEWVVSMFIQRVLSNQPPKVYGDGSQVRCFTYIKDIIEGMEVVREKGKEGEAYNIGNTIPTTILELAKIISNLSEKPMEPELIPFGTQSRSEDREIFKRIPGISKLEALGWEPKIKVEEGAKLTFDWFKENIKKEDLFET